MKYIYLWLFLSLSLSAYTQDCTIGNQDATDDFMDGSFGADNLLGVKFTLSQEGTLSSINLIGNGTEEGVQMAVYDDSFGTPNDLIAASGVGTVGNGIVSLPVTPTLLPPGDYWVMAVYEVGGNSSDRIDDVENTIYYIGLPFGSAIPTNASNFENYTGHDFLYFLDIECSTALSVSQNSFDEGISLYPNPSSDYIQLSMLAHPIAYHMYNSLGEELINGTVSDKDVINIQGLPNGVYVLKFETGKAMSFVKR